MIAGCCDGSGYWVGATIFLTDADRAEVAPIALRVAGRYRRGEVAQMKYVVEGFSHERVALSGLEAEFATAKGVGEKWNRGDPFKADVGLDIETRWTTMDPPLLTSYDYDHKERRFVLATTVPEGYRLHGWAFGEEIWLRGERRPRLERGKAQRRFLTVEALHLLPFHKIRG